MRKFFKENDIISAEVQQVGSQDGKITLQTRNIKYGKLANGFLTKVDANFIRRGKSHIHDLSELGLPGVSVILGTNGYVWIQPSEELKPKEKHEVVPVPPDLRKTMSLLRNIIIALEKSQIPIYKDTVVKTVDSVHRLGLEAKDLLKAAIMEKVTSEAKQLVAKEISLHRPQQTMLSFSGGDDFMK